MRRFRGQAEVTAYHRVYKQYREPSQPTDAGPLFGPATTRPRICLAEIRLRLDHLDEIWALRGLRLTKMSSDLGRSVFSAIMRA
jgi:hypothetical protein